MYIYVYTYIYIYIYICFYTHTHTHIYIYIMLCPGSDVILSIHCHGTVPMLPGVDSRLQGSFPIYLVVFPEPDMYLMGMVLACCLRK